MSNEVAQELPSAVIRLGLAINPLCPVEGVKTAINTVGTQRVVEIAESVEVMSKRKTGDVIALLILAWSTGSLPLSVARKALEDSGAPTVMIAYAARLYASGAKDDLTAFNLTALNQLSGVARRLSGVPTISEVNKAAMGKS